MIELKKIGFDQIPLLREYSSHDPSRSCDHTYGTLVMWRDYFGYGCDEIDGTLIISSTYGGETSFSFPIGRNPAGALDEMESYCRERGIPLVIYTHSDEESDFLKARYSSYIAYAERKWFDYIYDARALRDLQGKKYAAIRNHISRFKRDNPGAEYRPVQKEDIPELLDYVANYHFHSEKDSDTAQTDLEKCTEVLKNFDVYGFSGGVLRADGKIIGFTLGELTGDTLFVHIEKADVAYSGVYQFLSNSFLKQVVDDNVNFVNREDDSGDPGLRKSKLSYNPLKLVLKTTFYIDLNAKINK